MISDAPDDRSVGTSGLKTARRRRAGPSQEDESRGGNHCRYPAPSIGQCQPASERSFAVDGDHVARGRPSFSLRGSSALSASRSAISALMPSSVFWSVKWLSSFRRCRISSSIFSARWSIFRKQSAASARVPPQQAIIAVLAALYPASMSGRRYRPRCRCGVHRPA